MLLQNSDIVAMRTLMNSVMRIEPLTTEFYDFLSCKRNITQTIQISFYYATRVYLCFSRFLYIIGAKFSKRSFQCPFYIHVNI